MLSIRLNPEVEKELKEVAEFEGLSVSDYVRNIINEKLEDMYDLRIYEKSKAEFDKNPVTYSLDEVMDEIGI